MLHRVVHDNGVEAVVGKIGMGCVPNHKGESVGVAQFLGQGLRLLFIVGHNVHAHNMLHALGGVVHGLAPGTATHIQHGLTLKHLLNGIPLPVKGDGVASPLILPHGIALFPLILQIEGMNGQGKQPVHRQEKFFHESFGQDTPPYAPFRFDL